MRIILANPSLFREDGFVWKLEVSISDPLASSTCAKFDMTFRWSMSWGARLRQTWRDLKPKMAAGKDCQNIMVSEWLKCKDAFLILIACYLSVEWKVHFQSIDPRTSRKQHRQTACLYEQTCQNTPKQSTTTACKRIAVERKTSREPVKETPNMDRCLVIHD